MKHTALPWVLDGIQIHKVEAGGKFADGQKVIAIIGQRLPKKEAKANAEFIVRACNNHEELVEALKQVEPMAATLMDELTGKKATEWGIVNDCLVAVKQALAKATK